MAKKKPRAKNRDLGKHGTPGFRKFMELFSQLDEGMLQQLSGLNSLPGLGPAPRRKKAPPSRDPIEHAQDLVEQAQDAETDGEAVKLALAALRHDPQCTEAHLILGDLARTADEACDSYRAAMDAAKETLGSEFEELKGHFWGWLQTRPYMMARARLADALWAAGKRDESIAQREALLELNPNDNQGMRHILAVRYLEMRRSDGLQRLLDAYPTDSAPELMYGRALMHFRAEGDGPAAREALKAAFKANRHVPDYLLGEKRMPPAPPEMITVGGADEAAGYVFLARNTWTSTPEALAWLREALVDVRKPARPRRAKKLAIPAKQLRKLQALRQSSDEVWQVGRAPFPALEQLADDFGEGEAEEVVMVTARGVPLPLHFQPLLDDPVETTLYALTTAMLDPPDDDPRRPAVIETDAESAAALGELFDRLDIEVRTATNWDAIEACSERLASAPMQKVLKSSQDRPTLSADELAALPPSLETWQVDLRALPMWLQEEGRLRRPWSVMVVEAESEILFGQSVDAERPTLEGMWNVLAGVMAAPTVGEPHRPSRIEVADDEWAKFLEPRCANLGIAVEPVAALSKIEAVLEHFCDQSTIDQEKQALTKISGATPAVLENFYEAAALLFRAAPWRKIAMDRVLKITRLDEPRMTWYVTVIGQSGLECGLALYARLEDIQTMLFGDITPGKAMQRMSCLSLMYGEAHATPFAELDAIEQYAWQVAAPEAYPAVIRLNGKGSVGKPDVSELSFLEGAIRIVHQLGNAATDKPQVVTVSTAGRETRFEVSRVEV